MNENEIAFSELPQSNGQRKLRPTMQWRPRLVRGFRTLLHHQAILRIILLSVAMLGGAGVGLTVGEVCYDFSYPYDGKLYDQLGRRRSAETVIWSSTGAFIGAAVGLGVWLAAVSWTKAKTGTDQLEARK